jgi:hypothetical protein
MAFGAEPSPLLIDRAAAAAKPDETAIREWAAAQRVFVSSVIEGYRDPRDAAVAAIEAIGAEAVIFDRFGGSSIASVSSPISEPTLRDQRGESGRPRQPLPSQLAQRLARIRDRSPRDGTPRKACACAELRAIVASMTARLSLKRLPARSLRFLGLRPQRHEPVAIRSRFADAKAGVAGFTVWRDEPRSEVVTDLRRTLSEPQARPRPGGEVDEAVEIVVLVGDRVTDRFTRAQDGSYVHEDLVERSSSTVVRHLPSTAHALGA